MSIHLKRPKRGDQEDDLLRFQEEFLRNKGNEQPAAKVIKNQKTNSGKNQNEKENDKNNKMEIDFEADDQLLNDVLTTVKEKPILSHEEFQSKYNQSKLDSNIVKIEKINYKELSKISSTQLKTKSLFAQNLERQGKLKSHFQLKNIHQPKNLSENENLKVIENQIIQNENSKIKGRTQLITGDGLGNKKDVEQIHLENLELLAKMKKEDILQEQEKLMQQLDPKIISFIKNRSTANKDESVNLTNLNKPKKLSEEEILRELPVKPNKNWLNMNKIEYDKLEWMIESKNKTLINTTSEKQSSSARFDFEGNLITPKESLELPVTKALHHHGNEPDLAGYTLDELFHLARSKFNQQRVIALQTLSNIVSKCHSGYFYDKIKSAKITSIEGEEKEIIDDDEEEETKNDKHNLLNQLIQGGLLFLARCSLDDQTESIINISLNLIKMILQPPEQEEILDYCFDLYKGHEMVCLHPFSSIFVDESSANKKISQSKFNIDKNLNVNERRELSELNDDEYIIHDLIGGLFRMNLIERFNYLLSKYQPTLTSNTIINNIFLILFRCLRHSSQLCLDFSEKYSYFIDLIVKSFLPNYFQEKNSKETFLNAINALKLIRLSASAGPNLAFKLFKKYNLNEILLNYLTIDKYVDDEIQTVKLQTEVLRLLKIYSIYDNTQETSLVEQLIFDGYEIFIKNLLALSNKCKQSNEESLMIYLQSYVSLFDIIISSLNDKDSDLKHEICKSTFQTILTFTLQEFSNYFNRKIDDETSQKFQLNLMSCCLNLITNYLEIIDTCAKTNKSEVLDKKLKTIENLIEKILHPILSENEKMNRLKFDQLVLSKLTTNLENLKEEYKKIFTNNLTYLPTISNFNSNQIKNGPFCFLSSFMRLYLLCFKLRFKLIENTDKKNFNLTTTFLFNNSYFKSYFKAYCNNSNKIQSKESINNAYFTAKFENYFVYNYLKLSFTLFNYQDDNDNLNENLNEVKYNLYLLALTLISKLKTGEECLIYDLIANFIFNINIWSVYLIKNIDNTKSTFSTQKNFLINCFEQMSLENESQLEFSYLNINLNQSETIKINKSILSNLESSHIYDSLNQIKFTYLENNYLMTTSSLEHSTKLNNLYSGSLIHSFKSKSNSLRSLFVTNFYSNRFALPTDWIYLPIINELKLQQKRNYQLSQDSKNNESVKIIKSLSNSLKFIYLIENYFNDFLNSTINHTIRYIRLLYVYLFESEVFLDKQIVTYLYLIFFKYSKESKKPLETLNFNQKIDDIMSFYDFYQYILQHYDSTSFGDYLFSLFLVVPLQQNYNPKYRQLFWSDFSHLFKFAKFNNQYTKLLIPLNNFLKPNEKSLHLIRLYSQILLDPIDFEMISDSRLAYSIIISHLNSFIFEHVNEANEEKSKIEFEFKRLLLNKVQALKNEKLKKDLINFKCLNNKNDEFELFEQLPEIRKQWLAKLLGN